jgi:hypothetical protein
VTGENEFQKNQERHTEFKFLGLRSDREDWKKFDVKDHSKPAKNIIKNPIFERFLLSTGGQNRHRLGLLYRVLFVFTICFYYFHIEKNV